MQLLNTKRMPDDFMTQRQTGVASSGNHSGPTSCAKSRHCFTCSTRYLIQKIDTASTMRMNFGPFLLVFFKRARLLQMLVRVLAYVRARPCL